MSEVATQSPKERVPRFDHREADLCVACGLCLPVCPSYRLTRSENESPRGRLSLIRGLASGQLTADTLLSDHLHRCTLCLACETVCPAGVGFAAQMGRARNWLHDRDLWPQSLAEKILLNSLRKGENRLKRVGQIARSYQRNPIRRMLRGSGLLRATGLDKPDQEMPEFSTATTFADTYPAAAESRGRVALFKGCLQDQTDPETLPATIRLLTHLGYAVDLPPDQSCCGGLHLHNGDRDQATRLAQKNVLAFGDQQHIVGVASGCGAVLKQYPELLGAEGAQTAQAYQDIVAFLCDENRLESSEFSPMPARALVQEPCSHRNQLKQSRLVYEILQQIPQLDIAALPGNELCCGGAGSYSLSQPELANGMRAPKLDALAELKPDYLVTTNIGCALHLRAGLAARDIQIEILHPVVLLARQLRTAASTETGTCPESDTTDMV